MLGNLKMGTDCGFGVWILFLKLHWTKGAYRTNKNIPNSIDKRSFSLVSVHNDTHRSIHNIVQNGTNLLNLQFLLRWRSGKRLTHFVRMFKSKNKIFGAYWLYFSLYFNNAREAYFGTNMIHQDLWHLLILFCDSF